MTSELGMNADEVDQTYVPCFLGRKTDQLINYWLIVYILID